MIFDKPHTLGSDECWIQSQNLQSKEMYEYNIFNPYKTNILKCENKVDELILGAAACLRNTAPVVTLRSRYAS